MICTAYLTGKISQKMRKNIPVTPTRYVDIQIFYLFQIPRPKSSGGGPIFGGGNKHFGTDVHCL